MWALVFEAPPADRRAVPAPCVDAMDSTFAQAPGVSCRWDALRLSEAAAAGLGAVGPRARAGGGCFLGRQRGPVWEEEQALGHAQALEKVAADDEPVKHLAPQALWAVKHGVEGEGEQLDHRQQVGQAGLAVAEVPLEMVALAQEEVDGLVLLRCEHRNLAN